MHRRFRRAGELRYPTRRRDQDRHLRGEGLFLATLTGPGRIIVQSMTLEKLRRELAPTWTGGDEHGPLGALGGIFRSED